MFLINAHWKFDVICKPVRAGKARNGMVRYSMVLVVHTVHGTVRNGDKTECAHSVNCMVRNENGNLFCDRYCMYHTVMVTNMKENALNYTLWYLQPEAPKYN